MRPFVRLKLPFVSGSDVAGVIQAVGAAMTKFVPGEAVYAMTPTTTGGAYAEYVTVAADNVARVPSGLSLEEAAVVPLVALTAPRRHHRGRATLRRCVQRGQHPPFLALASSLAPGGQDRHGQPPCSKTP